MVVNAYGEPWREAYSGDTVEHPLPIARLRWREQPDMMVPPHIRPALAFYKNIFMLNIN